MKFSKKDLKIHFYISCVYMLVISLVFLSMNQKHGLFVVIVRLFHAAIISFSYLRTFVDEENKGEYIDDRLGYTTEAYFKLFFPRGGCLNKIETSFYYASFLIYYYEIFSFMFFSK